MRIAARHPWRGLLASALLCAAGSAQAATHHFYVPFTLEQSSGTKAQNIWLADTANLGNPPFQLTNQVLDGPFNGSAQNIAILDDWTYNTTTRFAEDVEPQLVVYGVAGHLYKADLHKIGPVQQFSSASYGELCSLIPLDERPFAAAKAYVQAIVEPTGSANTCASGVGTQTWLIPANADNTVAPTIEPTNWSVIGAFTDPTDGSFVRWIVWTGNAVAAYKANFSSSTTLLVGPPTGPAPNLIGRVDGDALLLSSSNSGGVQTDSIYHVSMTGSGLMSSYSYSTSSTCVALAGTSLVVDSVAGMVLMSDSTNAGYGIYSLPLSGSAPSQIYADSTGNECGAVAGDTTSAAHVGVNEVDVTTGFAHVISVSEAGPATQTPVLLASGANQFDVVRYTIDGHFWIEVQDLSNPTLQYGTLVMDGDGTPIQNYANSRIGDDIWGGYSLPGNTPGLERDVVYLFSPTGGLSCNGGTLTAVDPVAFTGTNISGIPADACTTLAFGWLPASVGYVQEPAGTSPVEIDPVGGKMYTLLGPDPNGGLFLNIATLFGYPFY